MKRVVKYYSETGAQFDSPEEAIEFDTSNLPIEIDQIKNSIIWHRREGTADGTIERLEKRLALMEKWADNARLSKKAYEDSQKKMDGYCRDSVVRVSDERNEFVQDVDGYVYWYPTAGNGHLSAHQLRWLADELDERNRPWNEQIASDLTYYELVDRVRAHIALDDQIVVAGEAKSDVGCHLTLRCSAVGNGIAELRVGQRLHRLDPLRVSTQMDEAAGLLVVFVSRSSSAAVFEQEFRGQFTSSDKERQLRGLAILYHQECEAFDCAVCDSKDENGVAWPQTSSQHAKVNQHAQELRDRLATHAAAMGFDRRAWQRAISDAAK
jgi:hypothetical protein